MDQAAFNTTTQWTTFGEDDQLRTKVIKDVTIVNYQQIFFLRLVLRQGYACCLTKDNVRVKIRAKSLVTNPPTGLSATLLIVYCMCTCAATT